MEVDRFAPIPMLLPQTTYHTAGAQSVVAVGVRWLKGNGFESGATPIKDKHVVS